MDIKPATRQCMVNINLTGVSHKTGGRDRSILLLNMEDVLVIFELLIGNTCDQTMVTLTTEQYLIGPDWTLIANAKKDRVKFIC